MLAVAVLVPVLTAVVPRLVDRRRKRPDPDEPAPAVEQVDAVAAALDEFIDDLKSQRDALRGERDRAQIAAEKANARAATAEATVARLQAELAACREQQSSHQRRGP